MLIAGQDGTTSLLDTESHKVVTSHKTHKKTVTNAVWTGESSFVTSSADGSVKLWSVEDGKTLKIKAAGDIQIGDLASSIALHPSGSYLAISGIIFFLTLFRWSKMAFCFY